MFACSLTFGLVSVQSQETGKGDSNAFIRVREVISFCPNAAYWLQLSPELKKKYFMANWSEEHLRRHLEMLKAFGFNSIQVGANPIMALYGGADPKVWRRHLIAMCRMAHEMGMTVSQCIWGSAVSDQQNNQWDFSCRAMDWHQPADRLRLEAWYRDHAELAPDVDRVITHWGDPGGSANKQCDIGTAIEMHNAILKIFRAVNPKIRGAFSLWSFDWDEPSWPGFVGVGSFAANPALDPNRDFALGPSSGLAVGIGVVPYSVLKPADLDAITASGRRVGVWGWYITDDEIEPSMHVRTSLLQNYFRNLPAKTHTALAWHSVDDNCAGLNMQNLYVAGHLMRDPTLDAQKLLDEFVRGLVGESNAAAVAAGLRAIEQTRTRSRCYDYCAEDSTTPDVTRKDLNPRLTLPKDWLDTSIATVNAAIEGLKTVHLAPGFRTAWPVTMEPADYVDELKVHLEAIQKMLGFLKGVEKIEIL